jgi:hypothetical protein
LVAHLVRSLTCHLARTSPKGTFGCHDWPIVFRRSAERTVVFDVALELAHDERLSSPLLPGFVLAVAELFPRE